MVPEPLVTVRGYATEEAAHADLERLHAANLTAYVATRGHGRGGHTVVLQVIESDADDALALLGDADEFSADEAESHEDACPRCQSTRGSTPLPPYLLIGLGIAFAVSLGLAQFRLWYWLAGWAVVSGLAIRRLERAHHWRCLNCHFTWNTWAEEERRAAARRAAPE